MTINIVNKELCPSPPYDREMVDIPVAAVPFALYGIWLKSAKYFWATPEDWRKARTLMTEMGAALLMPTGLDIVNAIDRLYVLMAATMQGTTYYVSGTGTSTDPYVYDPPLEQAPQPSIGDLPGLLSLQVNQIDAWRNLLNGAASSDYSDTRNLRQQIEDLINQDADDDTDIATIITALQAAGVDLDALLLLLA